MDGCLTCWATSETVKHHLLHCSFVSLVWWVICAKLNVHSVMPDGRCLVFLEFHNFYFVDRKVWSSFPLHIWCSIRLDEKNGVFKDNIASFDYFLCNLGLSSDVIC